MKEQEKLKILQRCQEVQVALDRLKAELTRIASEPPARNDLRKIATVAADRAQHLEYELAR